MKRTIIDASQLLQEATRRHDIHLSLLVASTGIWAHPSAHARWLRESSGGTVGKIRRQSQEIRLAVIKGPSDLPMVVAEGPWTAAACILHPNLWAIASEHLPAPIPTGSA
jgi:hypothetical protein